MNTQPVKTKNILFVDGKLCSALSYQGSKVDLVKLRSTCDADVALFCDIARTVNHRQQPYEKFYFTISPHYTMFTHTFRDGDISGQIRASERVWWNAIITLMREINECDDDTSVKIIMLTNNPNVEIVLKEIGDLVNHVEVYTSNPVLQRVVSTNSTVMRALPLESLPHYEEKEREHERAA